MLQDIATTVEAIKAEIDSTIDGLKEDANSVVAHTAKLVSRHTWRIANSRAAGYAIVVAAAALLL